MNLKQFQASIARTSITAGKIIAAIGQTPIEKLDKAFQDDLVFYGSLIQVAGGSMLVDFFTDNPAAQLGVDLTLFSYGAFVFQVIQDEDDQMRLTAQIRSANLREVLAKVILVSDPVIQRKFYWMIGGIIVALGNLLAALGRSEILSKPHDTALFNRSVTRGAWMEAIGSSIITLGFIYESMRSSNPLFSSGQPVSRSNPFLSYSPKVCS